ncbi:putative reverse transcriptase domain-containing protein [Tanacetum coccineum]
MNVYKGRMPTKIELTLEQSQQGVSNDVLDTRWIDVIWRLIRIFRPIVDHVYAPRRSFFSYQTQLQLQSTLIQTQHQEGDDSSRNNHVTSNNLQEAKCKPSAYNMGTLKCSRKECLMGGLCQIRTKCHLQPQWPVHPAVPTSEKKGHIARGDCRNTGNTNVANTQKGNGTAPKGNGCFECGALRHFKRDCPKLKNKDGGNGYCKGWVMPVGKCA